MNVQMLFVIGAPRSGTTMLERMLASHSMIQGGPEPHLLTPLAHLGVWAKVDRAPYDHILASEAVKGFVGALPGGEQDYWDACRAYCDVLYGRLLARSGKAICLDKTPAYGLILPFLQKVFPDAKYVVLTRHPLALFSSFANSFFDGDHRAAQAHNPLLERYVPALAEFLQQRQTGFLHVRYEDLVAEPEFWFRKICDYAAIPYEAAAITYGKGPAAEAASAGLGDPIGVRRHDRPSLTSLNKWVEELAASPEKLAFMEGMIGRLSPEDLEALGYPLKELWAPLHESEKGAAPAGKPRMSSYRVKRKLILALRAQARRRGLFRKALEKLRLTTDVLLRD